MEKYKILRSDSVWNLQFEVNEAISEGWEPQGNLIVEEGQYLQAMIKKEENVLEEWKSHHLGGFNFV